MSDLCLNSLNLSAEILAETEVLCLFGFSIDIVKSELGKWGQLDGKTIVLFTEDTSCFSSLDPSMTLVFSSLNETDFETFSAICQKKVFQKFFYHSAIKQDEIVLKCQLIQWQTELFASDYQDFGIKVFKNVFKNIRRKTKNLSHLKGALKGIPAFICGAGPSLEESLPSLKALEDKGVIFAGGAALSRLPESCIQIAAGVDPDPSWDRFLMQGGFDIPFFFQNRFSSDLLDRIAGPLFQVPSNPHYVLENWLEESLGEEFEGGWTSTSFCASLALYLGCSPVVFIGMDLAYTEEGEKYGDGKGPSTESSFIFEERLTQKDWVIVAKWLEYFVKKHPDTLFYTISRGALFIDGLIKTSLPELLKKQLSFSYDIKGKIHALKEMGDFQDPFFPIEKIKTLQESFQKSAKLVDLILDFYQACYPQNPQEKGEFTLLLFDLYEEVVYQTILEPLWKVWEGPITCKVEKGYAEEICRLLFFKKALQEYLSWEQLCKIDTK